MFQFRSQVILIGLLAALASRGWSAERVAVLPFADPGAHGESRELVNSSARSELERRKLTLVPADSVAQVLRDLRIRNTATPSGEEVRALADSLSADLVLVGTIHQFNVDDEFTEATVCARLIRPDDGKMIWSNWITITGGGETSLFSKRVIHSPRRVARAASRKLLSPVRTIEKPSKAPVVALYSQRKAANRTVPCTKLAVIPLLSESPEGHSGEMIADLLVTELSRKGFHVAEPGAVRNVMLNCDDLRHGQSVEPVSKALADSLGVDVVLTGTISVLTDSRSAILGTVPEVGLELRMIEARVGTLLWAKGVERKGNQHFAPFLTGVTHSPALLTQQLIRDVVDDLPAVRRRAAS